MIKKNKEPKDCINDWVKPDLNFLLKVKKNGKVKKTKQNYK